MSTSDAAFGFGQEVTGAGKTTGGIPVKNKKDLIDALTALAKPTTGPTLVTLAAGEYDFEDDKEQQSFTTRASNLTIKPVDGQRAELRNINLNFDLDSIDNVLIQDLVFHSNGADDRARDAIGFELLTPITQAEVNKPRTKLGRHSSRWLSIFSSKLSMRPPRS